MPTVTARRIVESAQKTLFDETGVRWTPDELLTYLSDAQREVVILKPTANTINDVVQLAPGTRQEIPAAGLEFIDVVRGMGSDGLTPGRAVRQVSRTTLDATRPDWHTDTADIEAVHYMFDNRDVRHFYVTPPQPTPAGYVEIIYAATPTEVGTLDDVIALDDAYSTVLMFYVIARAMAKDSGEGDPNKASYYHNLFSNILQGRKVAKQELHPEQMQQRVER